MEMEVSALTNRLAVKAVAAFGMTVKNAREVPAYQSVILTNAKHAMEKEIVYLIVMILSCVKCVMALEIVYLSVMLIYAAYVTGTDIVSPLVLQNRFVVMEPVFLSAMMKL